MASFAPLRELSPLLRLFSEGVACLPHARQAAEFERCRLPCAVIEQKNGVRALSELQAPKSWPPRRIGTCKDKTRLSAFRRTPIRVRTQVKRWTNPMTATLSTLRSDAGRPDDAERPCSGMTRTTRMNAASLPAKAGLNPCWAAARPWPCLTCWFFDFVSIDRLYSKRRVCSLRSDCA